MTTKTLTTKDFHMGLDLRRSALSAREGSLRVLTDCYINAGGEIEKRAAFTDTGVDISGTIGMMSPDGFGMMIFGGSPSPPPGLPWPLTYQYLPGVVAGDKINCTEVFLELVYVVVRKTDGSYAHYYNGVPVTTQFNDISFVKSYRSKMYGARPNMVCFTSVNTANDWLGTSPGAAGWGTIQLDLQGAGAFQLTALAAYYDQLALLGANGIQLWSMNPDPSLNTLVATLLNTGNLGPETAIRYGSGDVLFLNMTGIRSIKARDASNAAAMTDIGSPVDELTRPICWNAFWNRGTGTFAKALLEPVTGQVWFTFPDQIFVLTQAPGGNIQAWSWFTPNVQGQGKVTLTGACATLAQVGIRSANRAYTYIGGGIGGYDDTLGEVCLPFAHGGDPASSKLWNGIDVNSQGAWTVEVGTDSTNEANRSMIAQISTATYDSQKIGMELEGTHANVRLTTTYPGRARLGSISLHYYTETQEP